MVHIAMHDALNAIHPRFDQYAYFGRSKGANPIAAAAKAAHGVLVAVYPAQQAKLDTELATWLATVPNGRGKTKALRLEPRRRRPSSRSARTMARTSTS